MIIIYSYDDHMIIIWLYDNHHIVIWLSYDYIIIIILSCDNHHIYCHMMINKLSYDDQHCHNSQYWFQEERLHLSGQSSKILLQNYLYCSTLLSGSSSVSKTESSGWPPCWWSSLLSWYGHTYFDDHHCYLDDEMKVDQWT